MILPIKVPVFLIKMAMNYQALPVTGLPGMLSILKRLYLKHLNLKTNYHHN